MKIGAQLYTLRDFCKTPRDLEETLKRVADIGYTSVQLSGVCDYDGNQMGKTLKSLGLSCDLTHFNPKRIVEEKEATLSTHLAMDCRRIGLGSFPGSLTADRVDEFVRSFGDSIRYFAANGAKFFYHNHWVEFMKNPDGEYTVEKLLKAFTPEELGVTLDVYWCQYAGCDVDYWIHRLKGRLEVGHAKDMTIFEKEHRFAPVGSGNLTWNEILPAFEDAGCKILFVEQDLCYEEDPFVCMKKSYDYLKAEGLD